MESSVRLVSSMTSLGTYERMKPVSSSVSESEASCSSLM